MGLPVIENPTMVIATRCYQGSKGLPETSTDHLRDPEIHRTVRHLRQLPRGYHPTIGGEITRGRQS